MKRVLVVGWPGHLLADPRLLTEAGHRLGCQVDFAAPESLQIRVEGADLLVYLSGSPLSDTVVVTRGVSVAWPYLRQTLRAAESCGVRVVNSVECTSVCDDKLATALKLAEHRVPQLETVGMLAGGDAPNFVSAYTKAAWQSRGRSVVRHGSRGEAQEHLDALRAQPLGGSLVEHVVVQPAASGAGTDYRVLVAGGEVVAVVERTARPGHFTTSEDNSVRRPIELGQRTDLEDLAKQAALAVGANFCGVDLIEDDGRYVVLEVNASPGLRRAGPLCGVNLEERLILVASGG